jgi:phosphate transport system protein
MALIRSVFQDELDGVSQSLIDLSNMVSTSINKATHALIDLDLKLAEEVISEDEKVDSYQHDLDSHIIDIIARQQPVATDLRALVTALRMSADLERMGDLAHHIAKIARLRHPAAAVPAELKDLVHHMGTVAENLSRKIAVVIDTRDTEMALQVERDDDEMDKLHRQLLGSITTPYLLLGYRYFRVITALQSFTSLNSENAIRCFRCWFKHHSPAGN